MQKTIVAVALLAGGAALAQMPPSGGEYGEKKPMGAPSQPMPSGTQGQTGMPGAPQGKLSSVDQSFVQNAALVNQEQIKLGQLAVKKGTSSQVRDFGQKLIDDHSKVGDQLKQIATREGISLPTELGPEQTNTISRLSGLSGKAFDSAFMDEIKTGHQQAMSLFQNEAKNGTDPQLRDFAQSTLPALHQHSESASRPLKTM
jgi:putative membrane protein